MGKKKNKGEREEHDRWDRLTWQTRQKMFSEPGISPFGAACQGHFTCIPPKKKTQGKQVKGEKKETLDMAALQIDFFVLLNWFVNVFAFSFFLFACFSYLKTIMSAKMVAAEALVRYRSGTYPAKRCMVAVMPCASTILDSLCTLLACCSSS